MTIPTIAGMHHLKLPVSDLDASLRWYRHVLGAERLESLDHIDSGGVRYATILRIPGLSFFVELRWAPVAADAQRQCDLLVLAVDSSQRLDEWVAHLDALAVVHSPVLTGGGGDVLVMADPDEKYIRLMTQPPGGIESQSMRAKNLDPEGPWLDPAPMRHPRPRDT